MEESSRSNSPHFLERTGCPGCRNSSNRLLYRVPFNAPPLRTYLENFYGPQGGVDFTYLTEADYWLVRCNRCQLAYQRLVLDDPSMEILYEQWIDPEKAWQRSEQRLDFQLFRNMAEQVLFVINYVGRPPQHIQVLDYGMGWGRWCHMAAAFGCKAYGTELSATRIRRAQNVGVTVLRTDELARHQFDFINAEQVFEHLPQPLTTLNQLKSALTPSGMIRIAVPNGDDIERRLRVNDWSAPKFSRNSLNAAAPLEHVNCFNRQALLTMAAQAGLTPIKVRLATEYSSVIGCRLGWRLARRLLRPFKLSKTVMIFHRLNARTE